MAETEDVRPEPIIRTAVRSAYDAQKLRIEMGNRMAAQARAGVLSEKWQERVKGHQARMEQVEKELMRDVKDLGKEYDIWNWLKGVKGCGPAMSGVLLSELQDPERFATVSKLWAYAGLHTLPQCADCGKVWARTEGPEGNVRLPECECQAAGGEVIWRAARRRKGEKANWNPFLKAKLLGVLAGSFLKCGSPYREFYDNYRLRLENRPCAMSAAEHRKGATVETLEPNGCTKGHMHNKALRYMVKMFLMDFLVEWRTRRGLPVRKSYAEEYLGKKHSAG